MTHNQMEMIVVATVAAIAIPIHFYFWRKDRKEKSEK